ncbi:MAG: hypothetical protein JSU79_06120 [Dehalococcoidales bacterium]|nr:MAG: hypothetical protein JSU79_06120 [Dehalococcoidales bacterium]
MKKLLIIGIIVVFASVGWLPVSPGLFIIWVLLVWMALKKKISLFPDQTERDFAERYLKRLKTLLLTAGISVTVGIVGAVMHNVQYAINEVEESVFFSVALVGLWVFSMTTAASVVILLKGRRKAT